MPPLVQVLSIALLLQPLPTQSDTDKKPEPIRVFGGLEMPQPGYVAAIEKEIVEEHECEGLEIKVVVIPDLYVYRMALGIEEALRAGYTGSKLESVLEEVHSAAKRERGEGALHFSIDARKGKSHYFLAAPIRKHLKISGGAREGKQAEEVDPPLEFHTWTLIQGPSTRKMKLMRYEELDFLFPIRIKNKDPIEVEFRNMFRYTEVEKKSEYEYKGINLDVRQISLGNLKDLEQPPFTLKFYPGKWKLPKASPQFDAILAHLEK